MGNQQRSTLTVVLNKPRVRVQRLSKATLSLAIEQKNEVWLKPTGGCSLYNY